MRATVITDASYCPDTNAGGWAAWVTPDSGQRIREAGKLSSLPETSTQAELMAAINGIWLAQHRARATVILLQSDCLAVLETISRLRVGKSKQRLKHPALVQIWETARREHALIQPETRHVRGHTRTADARSFVNRWCDEEARKHMRSQRADLHKMQAAISYATLPPLT